MLSAQVPPRFARLSAKKCPDSDRREAIALGKALRVQRLPRDFGCENGSAGALPCVFATPPGMAEGAAIRKEALKFVS